MSAVPVPARTAAALLLAGVVLSALSLLQGIQPNDEGLMLRAAERIADGQVPFRDFWWFYPPGQAYLLGALTDLLGPSLLTWRFVRVAADATVALLVYALARRRASVPVALAAWLAALLAMITPSGPHPFPITLALSLGALVALERRPALAGALCGAAAFWRLEFAAGLAAGAVLGLLLRGAAPRAQALRFTVAAAAVALVAYLPVVVAAGIERSWELLVRYPVLDFGDYQRLPFPLEYDGPLNIDSVGGFLTDTAENLLVFYLPLVLVVGLAGALAALVVRRRHLDATAIATAVFSLVMLQYLLVRPDVFHTAPLAVAFSVLAAWAVGEVRRPATWRPARTFAPAGALVATVALGYLLVEGADRRVRALTDRTAGIASPVADGVRAGAPHQHGLNDALRWVRRHTRRGEPIYVTGRRADFATSGHPLFYVLAGRPNPTAYDIQAPGVVTSAPVQREIIRSLERSGTRVVVRWTDRLTAAPEPNAAGRSSGVRLLDRYIAREFAPVARFDRFVIYERRA